MSPELACADCGAALPDPAGACPVCATNTAILAVSFPDLPGFSVISLLGRGGMGAVYLADDLTLGRKVAIKVLAEKYHGDPEARERFLREARALAGIDHPNVLRIHSLGDSRGVAFIVMEYVEGESLARRISKGPVAAEEVLRIARQAAAGLAAAWEKGIVHRDVKPSNLLLDSANRVRVADFGLAKPARVDASFETSAGIVMGTPHYISPEQARGEPLDFRSDIYSLGVALYEMATGRRPFAGATPVEVLAQHLHAPMPALAPSMGQLAPRLEHAIAKMTQKRAADRPGSYQELSELLAGPAMGPVRTRWSPNALVGLGVVLFAGFAVYQSTKGSPRDPPSQATYEERGVDVPPRYLSGGTADSLYEYLPAAREKEGCLGTISVLVEFVVTTSGDVTEVVARSSKLAGGAMLGVSSRKYSAALKGGVPVRVKLRRRYALSSPFGSLAALRSQVDSIQQGLMPPELAVGCVDVLALTLLSPDPAFSSEAVRALSAIPRAYPVDDYDLDSIGWILAETNHPAEALQAFEARLARLPETAREYERLADGFAAIGERDTALKAYRMSLALQPGQDRVEKKLNAVTAQTSDGIDAGDHIYAEREVDVSPSLVKNGMGLHRPVAPPGERISVTASWVVTLRGEVADLRIHRSSGLEADQYISGLVPTWRYEPGKKSGHIVPVRVFRRYAFEPTTPPASAATPR